MIYVYIIKEMWQFFFFKVNIFKIINKGILFNRFFFEIIVIYNCYILIWKLKIMFRVKILFYVSGIFLQKKKDIDKIIVFV